MKKKDRRWRSFFYPAFWSFRPKPWLFLQVDVAHGPAFVLLLDLHIEKVAGLASGNLPHLMGDVVLQESLFSGIHGLTDVFVLFVSHIGPPLLYFLLLYHRERSTDKGGAPREDSTGVTFIGTPRLSGKINSRGLAMARAKTGLGESENGFGKNRQAAFTP